MATTEGWIDELKSISVLEISGRVKALEEASGMPATAAAGGDEAAKEQTSFEVILTAAGDKKIQ